MNPLKEECVEIINPDGVRLRGILHHADQDACKKVCLITLNTGLNDMVGWHRIQVKIARYLAGLGYTVLRFDDNGIGDSDGELDEESIVKIFAAIECGLFVPNADAAVAFLTNRFPGDKLVYLGFCGGGLTALHSAVYNKKISGIIDIGGPITLGAEEYLDKKDPWTVSKNIHKYKSKFFQIGPWIRFFTGRGEYSNVTRSIIHYLKHIFSGAYKESPGQIDVSEAKNLNKKFFQSFEKYVASKRPVLFYFAEIDSATWEFKKHVLPRYQGKAIWSEPLVKFVEVAHANHIFSDSESQEKMKQDITIWLKQFSPQKSDG